MKILFISSKIPDSSEGSLRCAAEELNISLLNIFWEDYFPNSKILNKMFLPFYIKKLNQDLYKSARSFQPDLVIFGTSIFINLNLEIMQDIKKSGSKIFLWHSDSLFNLRFNSVFNSIVEKIPFIDCHLTPRKIDIKELYKYKAGKVEYLPFCYNPKFNYPIKPNRSEFLKYSSDIAFVGNWRRYREDLLLNLVDYNLKIWGHWERVSRFSKLKPKVTFYVVNLEEMSKIYNSSKISLCLLTKENRDKHTRRTFQIPACFGFMLGERTDNHLEFFEEGKEAVYFDTESELKEKIDYYLKNDKERRKIAQAGYERCLNSGYSNIDRMKKILEVFEEMR